MKEDFSKEISINLHINKKLRENYDVRIKLEQLNGYFPIYGIKCAEKEFAGMNK